MARAAGMFQITEWNEATYIAMDGDRKLSQADVIQEFTGDLDARGSVRWQMVYRPGGTADWIGMQHIEGTLAGKRGGFVLQCSGSFDGSRASGVWSVVPGSGTEELENLAGSGTMEAPRGSQAAYVLDYEL